jgi:hypothetical protein
MTHPMPEIEPDIAKKITDLLKPLNYEQRLEVLAIVGEEYCRHCGGSQPLHGICQCWNDE